MTEAQKQSAIESEVTRGQESLKAARLLLASNLNADAVSRAYYAVLHFARALLLLNGEEPKTHGGVLRLLSRDFVRQGRLDAEFARQLSLLPVVLERSLPRRLRSNLCPAVERSVLRVRAGERE